ncbi:bucentaur or craniofacial development-domain-containing protein [Amylostereum chailletii]|nr:bucentaur or craniofacial development-domain-containing protein [Amylostereum chailletii]
MLFSLIEPHFPRARDQLWASFEASVGTSVVQPESEPKKLIKVVKKYRFAGEDVTEVVEVPEDSDDAKKWPAPPLDTTPALSSSAPVASSSGLPGASTPKPSPLPGKRIGPRKPKVQLGDIPTTSVQKAKKLSTLEKSAMDWKSHVTSEGDPHMKDELDANRRGGGYLEKVEFLGRVGERREQVLESSKGTKRRRG